MNDHLQKYKNMVYVLDEMRPHIGAALNSVLKNNTRTILVVSSIVNTKSGIKFLCSEISLYDSSGYAIMPQTKLKSLTFDEMCERSNIVEEILEPYLIILDELKNSEVLAGEDLYYALRFN